MDETQGCSIKEIDQALKTASKKGTGKSGFPEYVGIVKDFLLVIEDKADLSKHLKKMVMLFIRIYHQLPIMP